VRANASEKRKKEGRRKGEEVPFHALRCERGRKKKEGSLSNEWGRLRHRMKEGKKSSAFPRKEDGGLRCCSMGN